MLKRILQDFLREEGVVMAGVVGKDGFAIEYVSNGDVDIEAVAAMTAATIGTAERAGKEVGRGETNQVIMEYKGGNILIAPLSDEEVVVVVTDGTANLGKIRYEIKKNREKIKSAL